MSFVGACVFAGNNTKWKGNSYRVNGQLIGYVKLNAKLEPMQKLVEKSPDRMQYTIQPLNPALAPFDVVCVLPKKIGSAPQDTWMPGNLALPLPGKMQWEYRIDAAGGWVTRKDSTAVFEATGKGLKEAYAGSQSLEFFNVHDDAVDGGTESDSRKSFMEQMRKLNSNLDFFAYAGHGNGGSLGSACLNRKHEEYQEFLNILRRVVKPGGTIIFYACCTGVANGFAQSVSSAVANVTVFAHSSSGHGQTNPEKVRIYNGFRETFADLLGANDYVRWVTAIKSGGDLWRRYPFMTIEELKQELQTSVPVLPVKKPKNHKKAA